jgi:ABC-type sulfate/molybdate transport systems ATPase subunit
MTIQTDIRTTGEVQVQATLHCAAGRTVGLVGPSGAGKTTVLRAIAGLMPSVGTITVNGHSWQGEPTHKRRVGWVAQRSNLLPHLTAAQNIAMALSAPTSEHAERAEQWLVRVNLPGLGSRMPHQLSGGQQQRVALARALAREPEVLLLDEPFSGVDASTRRRLYEELQMLRADFSCATILVTHDVKEAVLLCDDLCVIADQRTLAQGPARDMVAAPPSATVARLLGWRNVIPASKWHESVRLRARFTAQAGAEAFVLLPHRATTIQNSPSDGALVATVRSVLRLPHLSWASVELDHVRLWGEVVGDCAVAHGEQCFVSFDAKKIRTVPV